MNGDFKKELKEEQMKEKKIGMKEAAIAKMLIKEIKDPLDLLRELISNSAAKQVETTSITISLYNHPEFGQVFEVRDNGIGMDVTGDEDNPGRLERFLSLGYSGIAGIQPDEFGWKGLGSKLAFRSKFVDVLTTSKSQKMQYHLVIEDPWECIEDYRLPKPTYSDKKSESSHSGTKIAVYGYPLYRLADSRDISIEGVRDFLQHRTFVGFTRDRENPPKILLKGIEGIEHQLTVGFPVINRINQLNLSYNQRGYTVADDGETVFVNKINHKNLPGKNCGIKIHLKGLYTLPKHRNKYGLESTLAQGLILSVNGIPYCNLDLSNFVISGIMQNPGPSNMCLVCECDEIGEDMNIGRNGYTASELTQLFERTLKKMLEDINESNEYNDFQNIWRKLAEAETADVITQTIEGLNVGEFGWVFLKNSDKPLHRIPQTEQDVLAILWKLEGAGKLKPIFHHFQSLSATGGRGTDLVVEFQESPQDPKMLKPVEMKKIFNPKTLGHSAKQTPVIICWNVKNRIQLTKFTNIPYKFTISQEGKQLDIYALEEMKNIIEVRVPKDNSLELE